MKKGETSGIIEGPKMESSVIKVLDRPEDPDADFAASKPMIKTILKRKKIKELRNYWQKKLRDEAEIVYFEMPVGKKNDRKAAAAQRQTD